MGDGAYPGSSGHKAEWVLELLLCSVITRHFCTAFSEQEYVDMHLPRSSSLGCGSKLEHPEKTMQIVGESENSTLIGASGGNHLFPPLTSIIT